MITTQEFLGLQRASADDSDDDPGGAWTLPLEPRTGGGLGSLFGGVGLAVALLAMAEEASKPAAWITAQFAARTTPGDRLDLRAEFPAVGRSVSQGRVIGRVDGVETMSGIGAVGQRREEHRATWATMPDALSPDDSIQVEHPPNAFGLEAPTDSIHRHVDARMAHGMFGFIGIGSPSGDNRSLIWTRMPGVGLDPASLAIMSDYSPSVVGNGLGEVVNCSSLDNTIRLAAPIEDGAGDEWVLLENQVDHVGNGFAHTSCRMWSTDGQLLALASQTVTVVSPPPAGG